MEFRGSMMVKGEEFTAQDVIDNTIEKVNGSDYISVINGEGCYWNYCKREKNRQPVCTEKDAEYIMVVFPYTKEFESAILKIGFKKGKNIDIKINGNGVKSTQVTLYENSVIALFESEASVKIDVIHSGFHEHRTEENMTAIFAIVTYINEIDLSHGGEFIAPKEYQLSPDQYHS